MSTRDRYGTVIHAGDEVSVHVPQVMPDHNGVGIVTEVTADEVTIRDAGGRVATVPAGNVAVDWTDYPAE